MNIASNVTLVRVSMVWLSAVAIALMLVVSNIAPATAQSTATVMVSNLGEAPEARQRSRIIVGEGQAYAHSFHTGSTAVTLEKVRLYLRGLGSAPAVTIRADNSGEPGRSLQALTIPTIDSLITTHEDLTTTGYVLAADTTYWLVLHRQWGSDNIRIDTSICDRLLTPEGVTTGEVGWSLGESLFFGLGSRWQVSPMGCRRMRMAVYASAQTSSQNQAANSPATGWPGITGTVRAGETLTATTDMIEDEDGLTDAVFAYRWVRQDPATSTDADIEGATSSTYAVTDDDEGKAIKVRVTFTDDAGNAESLTSDARLFAPPLAIPKKETPPKSTKTAETPLTAAIHGAPGSHNGQAVFKFELRFSEDPKEDFSYKTLRDHAFTVTGGTVTGARRLVSGKNLRWEITVQPSGNADVTVELPATTNCAAQGAICTEGGSVLSSPLTLTVNAPEATPPPAIVESALTVSVESVPTSHTGSGEFRFRIAFSEAPKSGFSYTTMRDHAFTVTGGSVTGARRLVSGKNLRWEIVVSPDSNGDVTITLPATTDCDAQGAICADVDKKLSNRLELTVSGPG